MVLSDILITINNKQIEHIKNVKNMTDYSEIINKVI
jgi:hypothetical protein